MSDRYDEDLYDEDDDDELFEDEDDAAFRVAAMDARLARLEASSYGGGSPAVALNEDEAAMVVQELVDLLEGNGLDLTEIAQEDFHRAAELSAVYGDPVTALNLVLRQADEDEAAYYEEYEQGVTALEETLERKLTRAEREALLGQLPDEAGEGELDVLGAWEALYGKRYTDDEIRAVEDDFNREIEKLKADHSEEYVRAWHDEHRPKAEAEVARMRTSGLGAYGGDPQALMMARAAEMDADARRERLEEGPPADDASSSEWVRHMTDRLQEAREAEAESGEPAEPTQEAASA